MPVAVVCVMGLPGAGKSFMCNSLATSPALSEALAIVSGGLLRDPISVVSFDDLEDRRSDPSELFDPTAWKAARDDAFDTVTHLRASTGPDDPKLRIVLLDDNFFYKSMRKRFQPNGIMFLDRSVDDCLRLNVSRSRRVPDHVIESMALALERPEPTPDCPVLEIVGSDLDDALSFVANATDFWFSVLQSAKRNIANLPDDSAGRELSLREQVLNDVEKRLRNCVSLAVARRCLPPSSLRSISKLKTESMAQCKLAVNINNNPEDLAAFVDSVIFEFSNRISSLE